MEHISQVLNQCQNKPEDFIQKSYEKNISYEDLKKEGVKLKYPLPEIEYCQFCNKELYRHPMISNNSVLWWIYLEKCDCPEAVEFNIKEEERKKEEELREQEEERKYLLNRKVEKVFKQSKLGERFKTRTFDNFKIDASNKKPHAAALKYAQNFQEYKKQGIGIMFNGNFGTGKTHLAAAITIHLLNQGIPVIFGTLINLLGKVKQTYSEHDESEEDVIDLYCSADLLIIDDLGKEKPTEWVLEKLYNIVNTRYENNKPIIITTNYSYDELVKRLTVNGNDSTASALASRLNEICRAVLVEGQDYRML